MHYADLHADTPYRMYFEQIPFDSAALHISHKRISSFSDAVQVFAFYCHHTHDDEQVYQDFLTMHGMFTKVLAAVQPSLPQLKPLFSVEDGRLLAGDLSRLHVLYRMGIRILTPLWQGVTCIGGAFDTALPLTDFGTAAVEVACDLGILPDISHASPQSAENILSIAEKKHIPCLATHSNAYDVYAHPRNLRASHMQAVKSSGGLIGVSMAPQHLTEAFTATASDILRHIHYYLENGCENCLALGCDFDGIDHTPQHITHVDSLPYLAEIIEKSGISAEITEKIMYKNIKRFFSDRGLLERQ